MAIVDQRSGGPALELHMPPALAMSRERFFEFCQLNRDVRIERNAEGSIAVMAPTGGQTGARGVFLLAALHRWAEEDGTGVAFDSSTGFELPNGAVRSPDAAWVLRTRLARLPAEDKVGFLPLCPDFVIELLSPSDSRAALQRKMEEYRANGARLGWLIDPARRQLTIYRAEGSLERRVEPDVVTGEAVLPGFSLDLAAICRPAF
jgi:Uma2 family endonuclease